jgi:hypothetical protein
VSAIQAAISGSSVVALEVDTNAIKYTSNIIPSTPTWVTISLPGGDVLTQVSISGTTLAGITIDDAIVTCLTAPSCSWKTRAPPRGEVPVSVSVNGNYLMLSVKSGKTYYSVGDSSWTLNANAPTLVHAGVSSFSNRIYPPDYYYYRNFPLEREFFFPR